MIAALCGRSHDLDRRRVRTGLDAVNEGGQSKALLGQACPALLGREVVRVISGFAFASGL